MIDKLHTVRRGMPEKANEWPNVEGAESFVLSLDSNIVYNRDASGLGSLSSILHIPRRSSQLCFFHLLVTYNISAILC